MKVEPGSMMWVYVKLPVGRVVGYVIVEAVNQGSPSSIWRRYGKVSGITRAEFFEYYRGRSFATVLCLSDPRKLASDVTLDQLRVWRRNFQPPQFFSRLEADNPLSMALHAPMSKANLKNKDKESALFFAA
jgi:predicted transcriptional regulator